ncbi:hypothetical protein PMAYCL1PPCAC_01186 [Pristionchus mayeri]|uniref:Uncharacterized protein n=1 Tax=Pristionchus mayeri TaxID=1317129 RepID=A0AAN4YZ99_9BILA|nr:hypothetical protein PMAYCL1PPCAC_01186 [Pristionchus mayeri]
MECADVQKVKERIRDMEEKKWVNQWAEYYLDVLEACKTMKMEKVGGKRAQEMLLLMRGNILKSESARIKGRDVLLNRLKELEYAYCADCDAVFMNYKQILLHTMQKRHATSGIDVTLDDQEKLPLVEINACMMALFEPLINDMAVAEKTFLDGLEPFEYGTTSWEDYAPEGDFQDHCDYTHGLQICGNPEYNIPLTHRQIVINMMAQFKQHKTRGREWMTELHNHIGDRQTMCSYCKKVTGTREEYYKHLRTYAQLVESPALDTITLIVNMYTKDRE